MKPRVELSGLGYYGVCTVISRKDLEHAVELLKKRQERLLEQGKDKEEDWGNLDLNLWHPFGLDRSMRFLTKEPDAPEVKLGWNPNSLPQAMETHYFLATKASVGTSFEEKRDLTGDFLDISASPSSGQGWFVRANFGDVIWDVIENPAFPEMLPQINSDIQKWWQDMYGSEMSAQYATRPLGRNGPVLSIYQPIGSGLWIAGDRQIEGLSGYQLHDHNTDTGYQAFAHVLSLCIILKHCRDFIAKNAVATAQ